jgi:SAM-dependent methyltransferase
LSSICLFKIFYLSKSIELSIRANLAIFSMISEFPNTWEEAVMALRQEPEKSDLVQACYYDDPIEIAAERFLQSEEWEAALRLLSKFVHRKVLDLGAGRGISSYAFAKAGCSVVALEPDPSAVVGAGAIQSLVEITNLPVEIVQEYGEGLPFEDKTFDIVYGRAVLHHARELNQLCSEAARVLKPGGVLLATREHVISKQEDLQRFFDGHPLHHLYGGENAFLLQTYISAIEGAGLKLKRVLGPWDSVINYAPKPRSEFQNMAESLLARRVGHTLSHKLVSLEFVERFCGRYMSQHDHRPGRHYSFLAVKP